MTLSLLRVREPGEHSNERLVLRAQSDVDVGNYLLCRTRSSGEDVYPDIDFTFWFPDKVVKKGDWVVVYTKSGVSKEKPAESPPGVTTHFFYWGLDSPIWNSGTHSALLMHVDTWKVLNVGAQR